MDKNFSNSRAKIKAFPCKKTMNAIHRNQSAFFINKRPKNARRKETCFREKKDPPAPLFKKIPRTDMPRKKSAQKRNRACARFLFKCPSDLLKPVSRFESTLPKFRVPDLFRCGRIRGYWKIRQFHNMPSGLQ